ncbi:NADPH-dependent FMN reductase [Nocardia sp. NPDC006982]
MPRIAVIIGSTRPNRRGPAVGRWIHHTLQGHPSAAAGLTTIEMIDLSDYQLPLLDEPVPPAIGGPSKSHTNLGQSCWLSC